MHYCIGYFYYPPKTLYRKESGMSVSDFLQTIYEVNEYSSSYYNRELRFDDQYDNELDLSLLSLQNNKIIITLSPLKHSD